jgi:small subunit ribosomal protein S17e
MGRIKITAIKSLADDMIEEHGDRFGSDFEKNKLALNELKEIKSKKTRNVLAGYITKQMQKIKKSGI